MNNDRLPLQQNSERGVSRPIAEMAYLEYVRQCGDSQSFERLHERGGFGTEELMMLLCQRIVFLETRFKGAKHKEAREIARLWPKVPELKLDTTP